MGEWAFMKTRNDRSAPGLIFIRRGEWAFMKTQDDKLRLASSPNQKRALFKERFDVRVRVEGFQIVERFADADEFHRQAQLLLDAENRSALGGAVELGQDDAGALDRLGELLGLDDGVLAGRCIQDEQDFMRSAVDLARDYAANLFEFFH